MSTPTSGSKTILLVDDDEDARVEHTAALRGAGYSVIPLGDGQLALNYLRSGGRADLILLGMVLPVLDGWKFLAVWKHDAALARIPVVIVTGLEVASLEWARSFGAVALLKKPCGNGVLLEEVRRCLPGE